MTKVMMMLGSYPFMLDTAAFQELKRSSEYRWQKMDRSGRKPAQQYLGPGADEISLSGEILPHWKGGYGQIDAMRAEAARGKPLTLIDGAGGYVLGQWVIRRIDQTHTELAADGSPHVIAFSLALSEYGADSGGLGKLGLAAAALSVLARLL